MKYEKFLTDLGLIEASEFREKLLQTLWPTAGRKDYKRPQLKALKLLLQDLPKSSDIKMRFTDKMDLDKDLREKIQALEERIKLQDDKGAPRCDLHNLYRIYDANCLNCRQIRNRIKRSSPVTQTDNSKSKCTKMNDVLEDHPRENKSDFGRSRIAVEPKGYEQRFMTKQLMERTELQEHHATKYLRSNGWNVDEAVNEYQKAVKHGESQKTIARHRRRLTRARTLAARMVKHIQYLESLP